MVRVMFSVLRVSPEHFQELKCDRVLTEIFRLPYFGIFR